MAIIVGDIHGDIEKTRAFLAYKPEQEHVALGDYLDSYIEPVERQIKCLHLLMDSDTILLLGNHECHYLKNPLFQFAGYQINQADILQSILETNIDRFKVAYVTDGWLLTHAGVHRGIADKQNDVTVLANLFNSCWKLYLNNRQDGYRYKSIFRFDFMIEGSFAPTNITQIFGHMEHTRPIVETNYIALDTTNCSNSCWLFDTVEYELVQLPLEPKVDRVRFQGGGWM